MMRSRNNSSAAPVYQAYLSPLSYHRWHCPVDGAVVRAYVREGTYYAEALAEGLDPEGPNESQGYIAGIATRAIVFIEADNPDIGLMAFMGIGMAEVSTCDVTVLRRAAGRKKATNSACSISGVRRIA